MNIDKVKEKIDLINNKVQISSFGVKWRKQGGPMKKTSKPRDPKLVKEVFSDQCKELDEMIKQGSDYRDVNLKMFKMKKLITGGKLKDTEPACINDPSTYHFYPSCSCGVT